jgi:hypothetical protein
VFAASVMVGKARILAKAGPSAFPDFVGKKILDFSTTTQRIYFIFLDN